jgi:hypothetical protein
VRRGHRHWADALRGLGCVKTEVYIDRELHHYRHVGAYSFTIPEPLASMPAAARRVGFVTWVT